MSSIDYLDLCRLCLVKESAFVPIFDGEGDGRQIFLKIAACLPVKVTRDDKLPKKICNECVQKIELFYQFCNTTTNAEKQLLEWIGGVDLNDKQTYVSAVINQDQSSNNRLDGNVMQQTNEQHQNNIDMNMMESIGLEMPMMIQQNQTQMTINYTNNTNAQSMQSNTAAQQQNNSKNMDDSDDDHCGGDDDMGQNEELSVKEEIHDSNRTIEPAFVNVSIPCEEAGPSGLQQKSGDIPDGQFLAGQSTDGDPKSGSIRATDEIYSKQQSTTIGTSCSNNNSEIIDKFFQQDTTFNDDESIDDISSDEYILGSVDIEETDLDIVEENKHLIDDSTSTIKKLNIKKNRSKKLSSKNRNKTSNKVTNFQGECDICKKIFTTMKSLKKHIIKLHTKETPYPCEICNKCFKTNEFLKIHMKQHNKRFICDICGTSKVSNYDLQLHKKKHNKEYIFFCDICKKGFYTNQTLQRHIVTHTQEKQFICTICKQSYASSAYLNTHMKTHGEREIFNCSICNFKSYWKSALKTHLKIHNGDNQYPCNICSKVMSSQNYLRVHMRLHSGEKPHLCTVCGKSFSVNKYLIIHSRTHTGEKPFECQICHKRFTQQSSLNSHKKAHHKN